MLLKEISPLHGEILRGDHDQHLSTLAQAVEYRTKIITRESGIRQHAIVTVKDDPRSGHLAGMKARVIRVNKKSVSIDLVDESVPEHKRQWRISPSLLEAT